MPGQADVRGQRASKRERQLDAGFSSGSFETAGSGRAAAFICSNASFTCARRLSASKMQERRYAEMLRSAAAARWWSCACSASARRMVMLADFALLRGSDGNGLAAGAIGGGFNFLHRQ